MSSLEQFGEAFFPPKQSRVTTAYGTVTAVNADGSYQVKLASSGNTRCARLCNAAVDDAVLVIIQENGKCAAVGKVGGESFSGGNTYSLGADSGNALKAKLTENGTDNAGSFTIPDGTTSAKGAVQLETSYTSDSETKAATPKSVKQAVAAAASYTDAQIIAAGAVTGVKGSAQANYQTGNVELSYADVGAAASNHTHAASAITTSDSSDVQTKLTGLASDVSSLNTNKAAKTHTHSIGDVTNLTTTLNGKAASNHTHTIANITNLQTTLDGKAAATHSHAISDVTGLQTALDGKASTSHTHTPASIGAAAASHTHTSDALWYDSDQEATIQDCIDALDTAVTGKAAKADAIKNISRSGLTFTATRCDDTTFTFTQKDTTYSTMTKAQADSGSQTGGYLISPKVLSDYVSEHAGGQFSYSTLYSAEPGGGSFSTVTLSESAANFDHMVIYFRKMGEQYAYGSVQVYKPDGKKVSLILANPYDGDHVQYIGKVVYINGTSITNVDREGWLNLDGGITGGGTVASSSSTIQIQRVEAW